MSSIEEAPNYPALVIDGSGASFFSGVLDRDDNWLAMEAADAPALESLFDTVQSVLDTAGIELKEIQSYVYCEGPGSVLGLRLCAMAIETWRRLYPTRPSLYAYNSLELVAADLLRQGKVKEDSLLISDWKKDIWNGLRLNAGGIESVASVRSDELTDIQGPLYHLPARKGWQRPPENSVELAYKPERLAGLLNTPGLIKKTTEVSQFQSALNTFKKWTPERHRALPQ